MEGTCEGRRGRGDPERDGRRTLVNRWESRLWRLEDKHLRDGSSVGQIGRPRPLRIHYRRRRCNKGVKNIPRTCLGKNEKKKNPEELVI